MASRLSRSTSGRLASSNAEFRINTRPAGGFFPAPGTLELNAATEFRPARNCSGMNGVSRRGEIGSRQALISTGRIRIECESESKAPLYVFVVIFALELALELARELGTTSTGQFAPRTIPSLMLPRIRS